VQRALEMEASVAGEMGWDYTLVAAAFVLPHLGLCYLGRTNCCMGYKLLLSNFGSRKQQSGKLIGRALRLVIGMPGKKDERMVVLAAFLGGCFARTESC
jgi:hypothetical protein